MPSSVTVAPCPSGFAPVVEVNSNASLEFYPGIFDGMPLQDIHVAFGLAVLFALGFIGGVK